jgi:hypothetical protein
MKTYIIYIINLFVIITIYSCQKVIDVDLNAVSPQIVIEGNIYDRPGPYTVNIFKTVNFSDPNIYPPVSGAFVQISDDAGNSEVLSEAASGTYTCSTLGGKSGRTYTLTVRTSEQTYTAISSMPDPIEIDSIYIEKTILGDEKLVSLKFKDPAGIDNYYRLIEFKNGIRQKGFEVSNDKLSLNGTITYSIYQNTDSTLNSGDKVTVWLESIDNNMYDYFRTAADDGESASPSNPISNISNGALGYFNACAVRTKDIIVP